MTQNQMIKEHLEKYGSITAKEAADEYGCQRLAARISDLREDGLEIASVSESRRNRFGKSVTYSRYIMRKAK